MKGLPAVFIVLMLSIPAVVAAQDVEESDTPSGSACTSLEQLAWLSGAWESSGGRTIFRESWTRVSDQTWEGFGQVLNADERRVRSEESLRLVWMAGGLFYVAKVAHNELPIAFAATECADGYVVFENPDHDFPKRIAYRRTDADHVTVDVDDGAGEGFTLEFARVNK